MHSLIRPSDVPDGWVDLRLSDACTKIGSGATPRGGQKAYLDDGSYALIRSQNVHNDRFRHAGLVYINEPQASGLKNVQVRPDDVLLNITGDSVARSCLVAIDVLPARVNQHVAILRTNPKILSPSFLRYALVSPMAQAQLLSLAASGATRKALTKRQLESLTIRAPRSVGHQDSLTTMLSTLDDAIKSNHQQCHTLKEVAKTIYKSWFIDFDPVRAKRNGIWKEGTSRPGLPSEFYHLFPCQLTYYDPKVIPEGWQMRSIQDIATNLDASRVPLSGKERLIRPGRYPYYGAAGEIDHIDDYIYDGIYVLIGEDGSVVTKNGLPISQYVFGKFWVNNHAHVLEGTASVSTEHLYLYFNFESVLPFVTGAVQPKLSQGRLNTMPFLYPGDAVCSAFSSAIGPLFARFRQATAAASVASHLRNALLPKLFSGTLRM